MAGNNQSEWVPPVAFYFKVVFQGTPKIPDANFMEVSGLSARLEVEVLQEGGENGFVYQIPKQVKHDNLVLKRATEPLDNALETWVKNCFENGFGKKIKTYDVVVFLMNEKGSSIRCWFCSRAYPVKWDVGVFNAMNNKLAIETLELCYDRLERKK